MYCAFKIGLLGGAIGLACGVSFIDIGRIIEATVDRIFGSGTYKQTLYGVRALAENASSIANAVVPDGESNANAAIPKAIESASALTDSQGQNGQVIPHSDPAAPDSTVQVALADENSNETEDTDLLLAKHFKKENTKSNGDHGCNDNDSSSASPPAADTISNFGSSSCDSVIANGKR